MKLVLTPQTLPDVESANVIADIKGSEHPEQVDHRFWSFGFMGPGHGRDR